MQISYNFENDYTIKLKLKLFYQISISSPDSQLQDLLRSLVNAHYCIFNEKIYNNVYYSFDE